MTKRFTLHFCPLDRHCRQYDPPARLSLNTPWWYAGVALTPGSRYVEMAPPYKARWAAGERFDWTTVPIVARWTDVKRHREA